MEAKVKGTYRYCLRSMEDEEKRRKKHHQSFHHMGWGWGVSNFNLSNPKELLRSPSHTQYPPTPFLFFPHFMLQKRQPAICSIGSLLSFSFFPQTTPSTGWATLILTHPHLLPSSLPCMPCLSFSISVSKFQFFFFFSHFYFYIYHQIKILEKFYI